jgi:hypothetical protein
MKTKLSLGNRLPLKATIISSSNITIPIYLEDVCIVKSNKYSPSHIEGTFIANGRDTEILGNAPFWITYSYEDKVYIINHCYSYETQLKNISSGDYHEVVKFTALSVEEVDTQQAENINPPQKNKNKRTRIQIILESLERKCSKNGNN